MASCRTLDPRRSASGCSTQKNLGRIFRNRSTVKASRNRLIANNEVRLHSLNRPAGSCFGISAEGLFIESADLHFGESRPNALSQKPHCQAVETSLSFGDYAKVFVNADFVAFTFDYRGFGGSEGEKWLCLPKTLSGMTCRWRYGNEAADGRVSDPAAACYPVVAHATSAA